MNKRKNEAARWLVILVVLLAVVLSGLLCWLMTTVNTNWQ